MKQIKKIITDHPIFIIILVTTIFLLGVLIISILNLKPTSEVEILVAPESASVSINGKEFKNGTYKLPRGAVSVSIKKDGFMSKNYSFDTAANNKLYDYLLPEDRSYSWYESHPEDAIILTKIGDVEADTTASLYKEINPISDKLPLIIAEYNQEDNYIEFRIDGGKFDNCDRDFCLKITDSTGGNLDYARAKIRELGFEPNSFEIIYEYDPIIPLE